MITLFPLLSGSAQSREPTWWLAPLSAVRTDDENTKWPLKLPNRNPPLEVVGHLPDPQGALTKINEGYKGSTDALRRGLCQQNRRSRLAIDFLYGLGCVSYAFDVLGMCVMITSALLRTETEHWKEKQCLLSSSGVL